MTDEKKKDKKENEGDKDAKKVDDEQLKDVAGGTRRAFGWLEGMAEDSIRLGGGEG